ncbi:hypothetical protein N5079_32795 [Planotetraspora sp. A-T 1434]|uniref:hypothetical protein n=1 Tax=Planotetraspora sp. A-T 1434 TaxID=2979219 RepID=UPI0021C059F4|nr:hypothetical protein [Planotetraspora sp. A-T 1434]MCT9934993.1 hypothetical protein [Planotetraspora sp. A-T 1434]
MSSSDDHPGDDFQAHSGTGRPGDGFGDLEAELRALGDTLHSPAPPPSGVARAVRARLEGPAHTESPARPGRRFGRPGRDGSGSRAGQARPLGSPRRDGRSRRVRLSRRKVAAALAVFLAVLIGATPQGRAAVASVLRFAGVEIGVGAPGPLPAGVPSPLPGERRVTLDEARRAVAFPIVVPFALGDPADVRVADGGRVVSLFWPGARLDEFDGTLGVVFRKDLGEPWPEEIPRLRAWWVQQPHRLSYVPRHGGAPREERVAAPTLIWQRGAVGLRLEGPSRDQALRIAASAR